MLTKFPKDSKLTLLNTIYFRPEKNPETGKYKKDYIYLLYKDVNTGKKYHEYIYRPEYTFYKSKKKLDFNPFYLKKEDVEPITCKFTDLKKTIAECTGNEEFFYNNLSTKNFKANEQLLTINEILGADIDIEDYYRHLFSREYKNSVCPITKSYFDIEVDGINALKDFPDMGECPVNAISFINEYNKTIYIFLLRNNKNPLIEEFERSINDELKRELQQFIIETVGGNEKASKYGVNDLNFKFFFYDDEIQLLQDFFILVNQLEPDFLLAWNMAFDIPYIIERLRILGVDPADILSNQTFEKKFADYYHDTKHGVNYEARGDFYRIASHTTFLDQLIHFASRRKGQSQFPNFKLDTAGEIIAGVRKLDYSHITTKIAKLPYLDYKTFVFYNIMDTIVQKCIETQVNDIDYIFNKCLVNDTRYSKGHRQTY